MLLRPKRVLNAIPMETMLFQWYSDTMLFQWYSDNAIPMDTMLFQWRQCYFNGIVTQCYSDGRDSQLHNAIPMV